ncbi:pyocin knob domain-containing protein [uncultured Duncaniella sp.]|uniref:pyocin knob domain-containing protein n=1 Tax=uncultured Duncaniella sp. TaxID=2768039 RepID=UPI00261F69B2|nr:pyocin knob domain-containing protein [uncultured Duncaniella sp.]
MSKAIPLTSKILKDKLPDVLGYIGLCTDFDTALQPGYYNVAQQLGTKNYPPNAYGWGILEVMPAAEFVLQRYTPHQFGSSKALYYRMSLQGTWNPWILITGTELS